MIRILLVEDDDELRRSVSGFLARSGYDVAACPDASRAYDELYGGVFDLIVTDVMMPRIDGFEFAETVRKTDAAIPILFLTARDDLGSKERGYRLGIDDYLVKPIDLQELLWRIEAILRRAHIQAKRRLEVGSLVLDLDERTATVAGEEVQLTKREFDLLYKLLSYPRKAFTRSQLMNEFWEADSTSGTRNVDVYITRLRQKFAACDDFEIQTVYGMGYKAVPKA